MTAFRTLFDGSSTGSRRAAEWLVYATKSGGTHQVQIEGGGDEGGEEVGRQREDGRRRGEGKVCLEGMWWQTAVGLSGRPYRAPICQTDATVGEQWPPTLAHKGKDGVWLWRGGWEASAGRLAVIRGASGGGGFIRISGHRSCVKVEDRWCGSSGSSERDRLRVTERNPPRPPRSRWRSGKHGVKALELSERLFDGHLRNCARFEGKPLSYLRATAMSEHLPERRRNRRAQMCPRRPQRRVSLGVS